MIFGLSGHVHDAQPNYSWLCTTKSFRTIQENTNSLFKNICRGSSIISKIENVGKMGAKQSLRSFYKFLRIWNTGSICYKKCEMEFLHFLIKLKESLPPTPGRTASFQTSIYSIMISIVIANIGII